VVLAIPDNPAFGERRFFTRVAPDICAGYNLSDKPGFFRTLLRQSFTADVAGLIKPWAKKKP